MDTSYSTEDILAFLEGEKGEEEARRFWQAVKADENLEMEVAACRLLIEEGRKERFQRFLKEVRDFDEGAPPAGPE